MSGEERRTRLAVPELDRRPEGSCFASVSPGLGRALGWTDKCPPIGPKFRSPGNVAGVAGYRPARPSRRRRQGGRECFSEPGEAQLELRAGGSQADQATRRELELKGSLAICSGK